jgi:hypothetical protein
MRSKRFTIVLTKEFLVLSADISQGVDKLGFWIVLEGIDDVFNVVWLIPIVFVKKEDVLVVQKMWDGSIDAMTIIAIASSVVWQPDNPLICIDIHVQQSNDVFCIGNRYTISDNDRRHVAICLPLNTI